MQVEAATSLAPVLARFAIVVDGPLEAEVLSRIVAGGDRATSLAQLSQPFPGRPELSRADAVAVARGVVARLAAGGTVEQVGGGYRIADPTLATTLQRLVESVTAASARPVVPGATAALAGAHVRPVAGEEASRLLQQHLAARWVAAPGAGAAPAPTGPPVVRVVVADPTAPPAGVAARLGAQRPVEMVHVPVQALPWGRADVTAARAHADRVAAVLAEPAAAPRSPVVVDRGVVPAVAVLAREQRLPPVLLVDLRAGPVSLAGSSVPLPPGAAGASTVEPSALAAAMAGAAATSPPTRRSPARRGARRTLADLLEVLFGAGFAMAVLDADRPGAEAVDGDDPGDHVAGPPPADAGADVPARLEGVVVTSRTDDVHAEALGDLLGVDVVLLAADQDLTPEVLAWLEDEDGQVLLPPRG